MNGIIRVIILIMYLLNISTNSINDIVTVPVKETQIKPVHTYIEPVRPIEKVTYVTSDIVIDEPMMAKEDIDLIALVTMAEAEGECEAGKRLVIDTILNRVDSSYFPDTVHGVIYQKNAFSSMWNGRVDRCVVLDDIVRLIEEELMVRQNYEVVFFTAGKYGKYGKPLFQVGNHYFASYE